MAEKKPTHEIVHPKLYLMVKGKMTHVKKGSQVYMTEEAAEGLGARVCKIGEKPVVDLGGGDAIDEGLGKTDKNHIKAALAAGVAGHSPAPRAGRARACRRPGRR